MDFGRRDSCRISSPSNARYRWSFGTRLFCISLLMLCTLVTSRRAHGQLRQGIPRPTNRQLLDLELDQQRARSNIAENRVTRQAEVSRLEGRLLEIESRLDRLATPSTAATGLAMIGLFDQLASGADQPPEKISSGDKNGNSDTAWTSARPEMLRLVAEDYILSLEIELARARIDRLKLLDGLRSLQQLRAKGLASQPQLDLQELEYQQAILRVARLEKLTGGYRQLLPRAMDKRAGQEAGEPNESKPKSQPNSAPDDLPAPAASTP